MGGLGTLSRSEEEQKKKIVVENRFEVLKNRVMQCGVKVRRQEVIKEEVKCFKCREEEHKK